jgi:hypothetical protein
MLVYTGEIKRETARLVFEDLLRIGVDVRQVPNLFTYCSFTKQQQREFTDESYVRKLRASAASYRIFKKYGWNKMDSGWTPLF